MDFLNKWHLQQLMDKIISNKKLNAICMQLRRFKTKKNNECIHQEIERQLRRDKRNARRELKLLLLGLSESGKSTVIKQLRIIHGNGYTELEKRDYTKIIYQNIIMSMKTIIYAMNIFEISYGSSENCKHADLIMSMDHRTVTKLAEPYLTAIKILWADIGIQRCYQRRSEFHLTDSTQYLMMNYDRIAQSNYVPTEQDILRVRLPTKMINEYSFKLEQSYIRMIDVGTQPSESKKWLQCFDDVTSIIFMVALSEYDEVSHKLNNTSRLEESKDLFCNIITCRWFRNTSVILFLNKKDLFEEKIQHSHLKDYFPKYDGPKRDAVAAREFILQMFLEQNCNIDQMIYSHYTNAIVNADLDNANIRFIFAAVKDTVLQINIKQYQLI